METHSPLSRGRRFRLSRPLAFLAVMAASVVTALFAAVCWANYVQHRRCQAQQEMLACAETRYWLKYHRPLVGDDAVLRQLANSNALPEPLECPQGGKYSARDNGDGTITIQCSLPQHQLWHGFGREGLRSRIQPAPSREE